MKKKIVAWFYHLPIIRGIIKKIESNKSQIVELKKQNTSLQKEIKQLKNDNKDLRTSVKQLETALDLSRSQIIDIQQNLLQIKNTFIDINTHFDKSDTQTRQIQTQTEKLSNDFKQNAKKVQTLTDKNKDLEYRFNKYLPKEKYAEALSDWYYARTHKDLNLKNPQTYNEKIQWLKLYDSTALKTTLADKYLVREFVEERIGSCYLIPVLGVWDSFEEIDFNELPDSFVLKATHGSAMNILVSDKSKLDMDSAKAKFDKWMHTNYAFNGGFELHYADIVPRIIAEQYMEEMADLWDYKFLCFHGEVAYIWVDSSRYQGHRRDFFDKNWNHIDVEVAYPNAENAIPKPDNLEEMLEIAGKLCQGFIHVRVDLYNVKGKIYFGEMTFTSGNGTENFSPEEFAYQMGNYMNLPIEEITK